MGFDQLRRQQLLMLAGVAAWEDGFRQRAAKHPSSGNCRE